MERKEKMRNMDFNFSWKYHKSPCYYWFNRREDKKKRNGKNKKPVFLSSHPPPLLPWMLLPWTISGGTKPEGKSTILGRPRPPPPLSSPTFPDLRGRRRRRWGTARSSRRCPSPPPLPPISHTSPTVSPQTLAPLRRDLRSAMSTIPMTSSRVTTGTIRVTRTGTWRRTQASTAWWPLVLERGRDSMQGRLSGSLEWILSPLKMWVQCRHPESFFIFYFFSAREERTQ